MELERQKELDKENLLKQHERQKERMDISEEKPARSTEGMSKEEQQIELMKKEEDIRAHNYKDVEYRKLLKEQQMKEAS